MVDNLSVDLKRFTVSTYIKFNYKDKQACLVILRKNETLSSECLNETRFETITNKTTQLKHE